MLNRLLTQLVGWLSQPIAGDRVVVIEPINLFNAGMIQRGATGFVVWTTAFEYPALPIGRVRFDEQQAALAADSGNELHVWPLDTPLGPATWRHFKKVRPL